MKKIFTLVFSAIVLSVSAQNFTWTAQSSGTNDWLNDIHFVDTLTGWAVGDNGTIVATVDGGETWTTQTSGTTERLMSVYFLSDTLGWIAGGQSASSNVLLMTEDGGSNWTPVAHDIPNEETFLRAIQFYDADHGFTITSPHNIYYTSNGGTNWEKGTYTSSMSQVIVNDLYVISDTSAFTAGKYRNSLNQQRPGVFDNIVNFAGEWIPQGYGEFTTGDELTAIHFTDNLKGFVGGHNGKIYTMEADGNIFPSYWAFNFDTDNGTIWSIDFADNDHGMFNTSIDKDGTTIQLIYHTSDAGETWSSSPDSIPDFLHGMLSTGNTENAWIVGSGGKIFKGTPKDDDITSVKEQKSVEFAVMPNPFSSSILIKSQDAHKGVQLNVFSYTGQLVESVYVGDFQYSYELEGLDQLESGVYFLQMKSTDGSLNSTQKIVKQ
jgi:photosystem II stability/assembly factor-like uncharacterized protein